MTSKFENTTMQEVFNISDVLIGYRVYANDGYKLHASCYDEPIIDEETGEETGEVILGYTDGYIQLSKAYDFETNPLDIFAVLESETDKKIEPEEKQNESI